MPSEDGWIFIFQALVLLRKDLPNFCKSYVVDYVIYQHQKRVLVHVLLTLPTNKPKQMRAAAKQSST